MTHCRAPARPGPRAQLSLMGRIGLVLGAGGTAGHAFHSGVLAALEESTGWDPRGAEIVVGTSAGSIIAALLRAGVGGPDLLAQTLRRPVGPEAQAVFARAGRRGGGPLPRPGAASTGRGPSAASLLLRPWGVRPGAMVAAMLPAGKVSTEVVAAGVRNVYGDTWPDRPTWICAVRLDRGRLVVFGRSGSPRASMADAVAASCAIPAYFAPVEIGGVRHVDGGAHSVTNADLLAGLGLDLVLVSCPMGSTGDSLNAGLDLPLRAAVRARLGREVAALRRSGTEVITFLPTRADRAAMGNNAMDPRRRHAIGVSAHASTLERLGDPGLAARLKALA